MGGGSAASTGGCDAGTHRNPRRKGDRTVDHKTIIQTGLAAVAFGVILGVGAGWLEGKWIPVGLAAAITLILI